MFPSVVSKARKLIIKTKDVVRYCTRGALVQVRTS